MACLTVRPLLAGGDIGHACYRYTAKDRTSRMWWAFDIGGRSLELLEATSLFLGNSKRGLPDENRLDKPPS